MFNTRVCRKVLPELCKGSRRSRHIQYSQLRRASGKSELPKNNKAHRRELLVRTVTVGLISGIGAAIFVGATHAHAESPESRAPKTEKELLAAKEEIRDQISSQHLQVKKSWENPGVYAWGSNSGKVAAPDSDEDVIKTPRRIPFFDGLLLRDMKLDKNFGAAIDEKGDLLQWGTGYSRESTQPTTTLTGKDLVSLAVSRDRIIGLSSNGIVYSIPVSKEDQMNGPKLSEGTRIPFWSAPSKISYRLIQPREQQWGEKISAISGGLEHVLLLTSKGRLFSAAASGEEFPSKGQLGVPGLTWSTRPEGPYDQPHELTTLRGFEIVKIAAGDYHSLALDKDGRVFSFGDNSVGQLGFDYNREAMIVDAPSLIPIQRLYQGTKLTPKVTDIAAGGSNSFFTVEATSASRQIQDPDAPRQLDLGRVTADTFGFGQGIFGGLGNGRWTHVQGTPTKIKSLSGMFEWDEKRNRVTPIRLAYISVGQTHASAVMDNVTHVDASTKGSEHDTNFGADVLWWGGNEFYQLGSGKRNNMNVPSYMSPLDLDADKEKGQRGEHRFQITPKKRVKVNGRNVDIEQRVECGRNVTAVYSGV